jgi:4-hydroxybenzoyl-CoA thioesterase
MSIAFRAVHPIRFSHCDPGGIVYFPHFFDFINATVEDWYDQAIETPFEEHLLRRRMAMPVVSTQCEFFKPSYIGDRLEMELAIARLGTSTIDFQITGRSNGEQRLRSRHVIAMVSLENYHPVPLPESLCAQVAPYTLGLPPLQRIDTRESALPASFASHHLLRFSHCDPAGILYFPNTFDMITATVEDWFAKALGRPFNDLHIRDRMGVPIVDTRCEFIKPSRIGEDLTIGLSVARLGRSSVTLRVKAIVAGEERMRGRHVIAFVALDNLKSVPIPQDLKARMAQYCVEPEGLKA